MININLVPESLRKKGKSKIFSIEAFHLPKESVVTLIGGVLVPLFIVSFVLLMLIFVKFSLLKKESRHWQAILPEKSKVEAVITELKSLQSKFNSIEGATITKQILWSQKLNDISDRIPRGAWLNKLSFDNRILLIDGSAVSKMKDEMVSLGNFVETIKQAPGFVANLDNTELGSFQRRQIKAVDVVDFVITVKLK